MKACTSDYNRMKPNRFTTLLGVIACFILAACQSRAPVTVEQWEVGTSSLMLDDWSQDEFVRLADEGIRYLELYMGSQRDKSDSEISEWVADIKSKSDSAGIEVRSVHLPFGRTLDISSLNDEDRLTTIEEHKRLMALLQPLSIKVYVIHGSFEPILDEEREERLARSIDALRILTEEVKQYGAELALEVLPRTCLANTSDEILRILGEGGNGLRGCFDSNHMLQESPQDFVAKVGDAITTVHISDFDFVDEKHWIPGRGQIDWNAVIAELEAIGYQGPWMYEVVRRQSDDPQVTTEDLVTTWATLREAYLESKN